MGSFCFLKLFKDVFFENRSLLHFNFDSALLFSGCLGVSFIHGQPCEPLISLLQFVIHFKQLLSSKRGWSLNFSTFCILVIKRLLPEPVPPLGKSLIQCHILLLDYSIDPFILTVAVMVELPLHFQHILLNFLHNPDLHLYFDVPFFFAHVLASLTLLVVPLLLHVDDVVLPDFLLGLLGHPPNQQFLLLGDPHHPSYGLPQVFILLLTSPLQNAQHLRPRQHKSYLLHKEDAQRMSVVMYILHKFDIECDHGVEQLLSQVVRMEQLLQFEQLVDLALLHLYLHQIWAEHQLYAIVIY